MKAPKPPKNKKKKSVPRKQKGDAGLSVAGIVKETLSGQAKAKKKASLHPRVLISGYYGFDNLGDELILRVLVDELKAHQVNMTVLSQNPKKTAQEYGVDAVKRTSFIDIFDAMAQAHLFISGGGGLFQDVTGPMSAIYYGGLICMARSFEVPVCFWAQGVGPLRRELSRKMTATALRKCEVITVRDAGSAELVESLIGEKPEITADPVWLLNVPKRKPAPEGKKSGKGKQKQGVQPWRIGVSLRPWAELTPARLQALADCLTMLSEQGEKPVELLLLPFQKKEDTELLAQFAHKLKHASRIRTTLLKPGEVFNRLGECEFLIGMRFHSLILGLLHKLPVFGLAYDPKVAALLAMFELPGCTIHELSDLQPNALQAAFAHPPEVDLKPFKKQSRRNFDILHRLLSIPEAELVL